MSWVWWLTTCNASTWEAVVSFTTAWGNQDVVNEKFEYKHINCWINKKWVSCLNLMLFLS